MPTREPQPATADRMREDIDQGRTGEKVPGLDPAAAPLGTDDEAAGAPPTLREREIEDRGRIMAPLVEPSWYSGTRLAWAAGIIIVLLLLIFAFS